jgi:hypothetical protein
MAVVDPTALRALGAATQVAAVDTPEEADIARLVVASRDIALALENLASGGK